MPVRLRRVPGLAQKVGAPRLMEHRIGSGFGPKPGGLAQRVPFRTQPKQHNNANPGLIAGLHAWRGVPQKHPGGLKPKQPKKPPRRKPPQGRPGGGGGGVGGGGGGGFPGPNLPPGAAPPLGLMPDPMFEAQRRAAQQNLDATMSMLGVGRQNLQAEFPMLLARMATDQDFARTAISQNMNERGIWHSGIRTTDTARSDLGFDRNRQDLTTDYASSIAEMDALSQQAEYAYEQALAEAWLELGGRLDEIPGGADLDPIGNGPDGNGGGGGHTTVTKKKTVRKKKPGQGKKRGGRK